MKSLLHFASEHKLLCVLVAIALAAHYGVMLKYAVDIPIGDDYNDALLFLDNYANAQSLLDKLRLIHAQMNEHRTIFNRLVFVAVHKATGSLDFKVLIVLASLSTLATIALLCRQFRRRDDSAFLFSLIAIFLLNLQSWQSEFWAMTALSNYAVPAFALACFTALATERRSGMAWAAAFAVLGTFSMGNGLAIWPIGLLYLAYSKRQDRALRLAIWTGAAAVCLAIYFFHYQVAPAIKLPLSAGSPLGNVTRTATWYLAFLGSCWTFETGNVALAAVVGAALLVLSVPMGLYWLKRRPALACFLAFVLASGLIVTYSRLAFDPSVALVSRYRIYSVYLSALALATVYVWIAGRPRLPAQPRRLRSWRAAFLAVAGAHTIVAYCTSLDPMRDEQRDIVDSMRRWLLLRKEARFEFNWVPTASASIQRAIETGVWDPRSVFDDTLEFSRLRQSKLCDDPQLAPTLPIVLQRRASAMMGELLIDDDALGYHRIREVIACRQGRVWAAVAWQPSRDADGRFSVHYLKNDRLEGSTIMLRTATDRLFHGVVQQ